MRLALSRKNVWDRLPRVIKRPLGAILGIIPLKYLLGKRFRATLDWLDEAQWWPAERARAYQLEQLRRICTLAYERTPFYRRAFDAVGFEPAGLKSPQDMAGLPTITQDTVRQHLDEMCASSPRSPRVDCVSTGGTGGRPLEFYINADRSPTEYAHLIASWQRAGYELGMPMAVLRGRVVAANGNGLFHEYDALFRHHYYSHFHMTDGDMGRYLVHIASIGACFLHVYPSSVAALARFIRRSELEAPSNIRGIIAESETVYPEQRRMIEETFKCRYFSCYGHS
ncbi:MAG: phenylacetate--CoA ligase family protein, partial [Chloroflexi bacterium]